MTLRLPFAYTIFKILNIGEPWILMRLKANC